MNNLDLEEIKKVLKDKHIFIAYIEQDKNVAHMIWDKLNELGAIPWAYTKNDDNIRWKKEIVRTIRNSDVMILVFSKNTDEEANKHIVKEIGLASKNNVEIIPFMIDDINDIKNEVLAYELEGINWVRKTVPIEKQIDSLLKRLIKYFGGKVEEDIIDDIKPPYKYKWLVMIFLILLTGVGGYFIYKINGKSNDANKTIKQSYTIKQTLKNDNINKTILENNTKKLFICYENKENGLYIGCKRYKESCNYQNKKHFGKYPTIEEANKALLRCKNSKPIVSLNKKEIENFINRYYESLENNNVNQVLNFYDEIVDSYFNSINIYRNEIKNKQSAYNKKYPIRSFKVSKIDLLHISSKTAKLLVTVEWKVINNKKIEKLGKTIQKLSIIKKNGNLYIKSIDTYEILSKNSIQNNLNSSYTNLGSVNNDEKLRISDATTLIGKLATLIKFGGYKTPLCKFVISNDGKRLYFKEINSNCIKMKNSKNINIICNMKKVSKKQICKTFNEVKNIALFNNLFDYKKNYLPNKIEFDPMHPENFIFFAKDRRSLSVLRNLPFAIKGYKFKTIKIANYYKKMSWYKPNPNAKHLKRTPLEEEWWDSIKKFKLKILRNLPFAFKGAIFKDKRLAIYFKQFKWYKPNKNYIPNFNNLSEEDKEWIKEMRKKDPYKYIDFFSMLEKYLTKKNKNNYLQNINITNNLNINNEERKLKVENIIKIIFKNLNKTKYLGSNFDYWPNGGLQATYDHIKGFISYKTLNYISPYNIFLNNVHTQENLNLNSKNSFGYYNPKFIDWISDRISTVIDDGNFIEQTRKNFNKYLRNLVITYWYTYRALHNDTKTFNELKNKYVTLIKNKKLPDGFYYNIAWDSEKYNFMQYLENDKKLDVNIIAPAVYFWIRRSIDKTDEKIYLIFDKILRAYDSGLIFYETKSRLIE